VVVDSWICSFTGIGSVLKLDSGINKAKVIREMDSIVSPLRSRLVSGPGN